MEYKKTNRIIKFKRAYFEDENCNKFSHFKDWGVDIDGSSFDTPSHSNFALYFIDLQYVEYKDTLFCEGDLIKHNKVTYVISFSKNQRVLLLKNIDKSYNGAFRSIEWLFNVKKHIKRLGNIYENSELLS